MSGNGKRILPPNTATTSALIPISPNGQIAPNGTYGAALGRASSNDDLIDQLVGGLVQTDQTRKAESQFFNPASDAGASDRIYSIDDEEIDEPPVPIPSTWHEQKSQNEPSWFAEQVKSSLYGFVIGLFVVIPAVMLLTGQAERLPSWQAVSAYAEATTAEFGLDQLFKTADDAAPAGTAAPEASKTQIPGVVTEKRAAQTDGSRTVVASQQSATVQSPPAQQSAQQSGQPLAEAPARITPVATASSGQSTSASTAPNAPSPGSQAPTKAAEPAQVAMATIPDGSAPQAGITQPAPATQQAPDTTSQGGTSQGSESATPANVRQSQSAKSAALGNASLEAARGIIKRGDMNGARIMLAKLASRGDSEAIFVLAETFDPNVLAAWGTRGQEANSEKAKMFYTMALKQGVKRAEMRIKALE